MTVDIFWQMCDPDAKPGTTFREGFGWDELVEALKDHTAREQEHTPEGFIPSGNIALYWNERQPAEVSNTGGKP